MFGAEPSVTYTKSAASVSAIRRCNALQASATYCAWQGAHSDKRGYKPTLKLAWYTRAVLVYTVRRWALMHMLYLVLAPVPSR